jgi:16S rRNA (guanine(966)-N(2))-methyltransferase RsmD
VVFVRVIAGTARSCPLAAPPGGGTRPTTDRLKENLFNLLHPYIPNARFLDLFSGSGAIGIEALSRGAREAVFVERLPQAADVIRGNLRAARLEENAAVLPYSAERAIRLLSRDDEKKYFDIVFMDPPYAQGLAEAAAALLLQRQLLAEDGLLVAEISSRETPPQWGDGLETFDARRYGETSFLLARMVTR